MLSCGSHELRSRVEGRAYALSQHLIAHKEITKYDVHGLFGIFARGDRIGNRSKRYFLNYEGVKTSFMIEWACRIASTSSVTTVCEVGFCAGLSAVLLLEAVPRAKVVSFDLGDLPWSKFADQYVQNMYSTNRFPGVVFGDAAITIPRMAKTNLTHCDMVFVDGDKSFEGRLQSLRQLRNASSTGAAVFMDEVTSKVCVDGTIAAPMLERRCKFMHVGYWPSVRAYNVAVREGWLRVERCAWPTAARADGICMGYFV